MNVIRDANDITANINNNNMGPLKQSNFDDDLVMFFLRGWREGRGRGILVLLTH